MADELRIRSGTKLRLALDAPLGKEPEFNLICTFVKALDTATFLISIPMRDGAESLNAAMAATVCIWEMTRAE